jgi:ribosomal protein S18 acetylase RimI-like enzyme
MSFVPLNELDLFSCIPNGKIIPMNSRQTQKPNPLPIRAFDVRTDLLPVSDLVELCFADRLTPDGEALLRKMRSSARNLRFQEWAYSMAGRVSMPFTGYVWEEGGEIIGNLSLIPYHIGSKHYYMIANVAVHPDYQRKGIARSLVREALDFLLPRRLDGIWLQVDEGNQAAVDLYLRQGFKEISRRTTWILKPRDIPDEFLDWQVPDFNVQPHRSRFWNQQRIWLEKNYPPEVRWHLPLRTEYLRGGLQGRLARMLLLDPKIKQWAVTAKNELIGVVSWQSSKTYADWIWIASSAETEGVLLDAFLPHWMKTPGVKRSLRLDFPKRKTNLSLETHWFKPTRTLIWMKFKV